MSIFGGLHGSFLRQTKNRALGSTHVGIEAIADHDGSLLVQVVLLRYAVHEGLVGFADNYGRDVWQSEP